MSLLSRSLQPCRCFPRSFSTTSCAQAESQRKKTARLKKKSNIARRTALDLEQQRTVPNPILGYHDAATWDNSKLKGLLIKREAVWQESLRRGIGGRDQETLDMNAAVESQEEAAVGLEDLNLQGQRWNFGLGEDEVTLLFKNLPQVAAQKALIGQSENTSVEKLEQLASKAEKEESVKRDNLMRIVNLKNANARGVRLDNTKRVVEQFSRLPDGQDTGSPEVQGTFLCPRFTLLSLRYCSRGAHAPDTQHSFSPLTSKERLLQRKTIACAHFTTSENVSLSETQVSRSV